ncbi:MAG: type 2 isopentenyl-diphosphate Delta-isomerase [Bacteroidetes bacterium]|nr:MAG: type 2 isopentenyl-diphosphate Delta-isomerase [Bacteroidota bacterium]
MFMQSDPTAESRKKDHIELAFESQIQASQIDSRFYYEPLLSAHPQEKPLPFQFLGKTMYSPLWVSSMTGGTKLANIINQNLAKLCNEYSLGMGLGSCRALLDSNEHLPDFDVRKWIGNQPFYANLGIAQVEKLVENRQVFKIKNLLEKLQADGLIIHVNPMQEWLQPEGDRLQYSPLETIKKLFQSLDTKFIVKEVGQGMGYESLKSLLTLPLEAIDFAANGGTNFARLELFRSDPIRQESYLPLSYIGHSAEQMVHFTNQIMESSFDIACKQIIISGGIKNFLDGYYLMSKLNLPSIYGQASAFLKYAKESYELLQQYTETQIKGLALAKAFLKVT